ncbi:MAG: hypothetical protein AAF899_14355 [Pseudomonadota bacterium]
MTGAACSLVLVASPADIAAQSFPSVDAFYALEGDLAFSEVHAAATGPDPNGFFDYLPGSTIEEQEICVVNTFLLLGALNTVLLRGVFEDEPLTGQLSDWNPNLYRLVLKKCDVGIGPGEQALLKDFFTRAGQSDVEGTPLIERINARLRGAFEAPPPWLEDRR